MSINEIPGGQSRIKIIGSVVNISPTHLDINDGSGQISINLGTHDPSQLSIGNMGRFLVDVHKSEKSISGQLIAWQAVTAEQAKRYQQLVKIERRIPKE